MSPSFRRFLMVPGIVLCLSSTGCAAAAELGLRFAGALIEGALKSGGSSSTPSYSGPVAETTTEGRDTVCRLRREEWRETHGGSIEDAPPHLRCKPDGDWPDEETVRQASRSGF